MADASVTIGADATAVERAMAVGMTAMRNFASSAQGIGSALAGVTRSLAEVALAQGRVNFVSQHQQVREFEAATARMATSVGRDLGQVRGEAEAIGVAIGKRPADVVAWATEVGKLTYNFSGATQGMKGMAELAAMTGRSADDYRGLAVEIQTVGRVSGDTSKMVGLIKGQADALGTSGGVAAFADQIEALSDTFSHFSGDFGKTTELAGRLGKGLDPITAGRVQQSVLGSIASRPMEWSRFLGHDILDEQGHVKDPSKTTSEIVRKIERTYGKDSRNALMRQFGSEAGSQLHNLYKTGDLDKPISVSGKATTAGAEALKTLLETDAGKRDTADAKLAVASDKLLGSSSALGRAADALQQFASSHPVASTLATTAGGSMLGSLLSLVGKGGGGGGSAVGVAGSLGAIGVAAGSVMLAFNEIKSAADEIYGNKDKWASFVDDLKTWIANKPALAHDNNSKEAKDYRERERKNLQVAHTRQALAFMPGLGALDGNQIGAELARALSNVTFDVNVQNSSDSPITVTARTANSSAAGNQSGT